MVYLEVDLYLVPSSEFIIRIHHLNSSLESRDRVRAGKARGQAPHRAVFYENVSIECSVCHCLHIHTSSQAMRDSGGLETHIHTNKLLVGTVSLSHALYETSGRPTKTNERGSLSRAISSFSLL